MKTFSDVLESAQALPHDEQEELVHVLQHQLAEEQREDLSKAIHEARAQFAAGRARTSSPAAILKRVQK